MATKNNISIFNKIKRDISMRGAITPKPTPRSNTILFWRPEKYRDQNNFACGFGCTKA